MRFMRITPYVGTLYMYINLTSVFNSTIYAIHSHTTITILCIYVYTYYVGSQCVRIVYCIGGGATFVRKSY